MPWLWEAMKDVVSCDKLRVGANDLWSEDFRMGEPTWLKTKYFLIGRANAGNWNILVPAGRENNCDSASSGERTRKSPNQCRFGGVGVIGLRYLRSIRTGTRLESRTIEGESPVAGNDASGSSILSSAEHEEFCVNYPGPSGKAKYSPETDSEPVLWRKGEKHFEKKSEIVPETVRLQAVGAPIGGDGVPFA